MVEEVLFVLSAAFSLYYVFVAFAVAVAVAVAVCGMLHHGRTKGRKTAFSMFSLKGFAA